MRRIVGKPMRPSVLGSTGPPAAIIAFEFVASRRVSSAPAIVGLFPKGPDLLKDALQEGATLAVFSLCLSPLGTFWRATFGLLAAKLARRLFAFLFGNGNDVGGVASVILFAIPSTATFIAGEFHRVLRSYFEGTN